MVAGRKKYIAMRHASGLRAPGGRPRTVARLMTLQHQALDLLGAEIARTKELLRDLDKPKGGDPSPATREFRR